MMKISLLFFFVSTLGAFNCNAQLGDLQGKWTHAYEQDANGRQLFVNGEQATLPPARFRQVFVFQSNNKCKYTSLAANDAHQMRSGSYKLKDDILVIKDLKGNKIHEFRVGSVTAHEIMLEKL
jgi:hypothetical protein